MVSAYRPQDVKYLDGLSYQVFRFLRYNPNKRARTRSRVGDTISPPNPSCGPHLLRCKIARNGIRKHKVLPLPVRAPPRISSPSGETGRLFACTSVISTHCRRPSSDLVLRSKGVAVRAQIVRTFLCWTRYWKVRKRSKVICDQVCDTGSLALSIITRGLQ